jgi:hypothetical protein
MSAMLLKKIERLDDPRVESGCDMPRDLAHDVLAIFEPLEFGARRRRPCGLFAFLAVKAVRHPLAVPRLAPTTFRSKPDVTKECGLRIVPETALLFKRLG